MLSMFTYQITGSNAYCLNVLFIPATDLDDDVKQYLIKMFIDAC
jgi:hypothetical protein